MERLELQSRLKSALLAGIGLHQIVVADEERALRIVAQLASELEVNLNTWSCTQGINSTGEARDFAAFLHLVREGKKDQLYVAFDAAEHWRNARECRLLRELGMLRPAPSLILVDAHIPTTTFPPEFQVHALYPPDQDELVQAVSRLAKSIFAHDEAARQQLIEQADDLARMGIGLEVRGFTQILRRAAAKSLDISRWREFLGSEKRNEIDPLSIFESPSHANIDEVGGLTQLKRWLQRRALALQPEARAYGIAPPRGILLVGVQGCGKSLAARACANVLGLPLLRLDPGRIFAGTVGASEANIRSILAHVERLAPAVLWLDEIDKSLAGADGSRSDGGTTSRVMATLLTWLAEREKPIFVAATANRLDALPPELLRRGRLDEIFFVDLPGPEDREAIVDVHLRKLPERRFGVAPELADPWERFAAVAREADGYSGAELEAAITEARLAAFARREPVAARDLVDALLVTIPFQTSHATSVAALRAWARTCARMA
jgi:ATP-dependent 26S proteasome regulatory subunit